MNGDDDDMELLWKGIEEEKLKWVKYSQGIWAKKMKERVKTKMKTLKPLIESITKICLPSYWILVILGLQ